MRVTEAQTRRTVISQITSHRNDIDKYSNQVTTGLKVEEPGDSKQSGTISRYRESLNRNEAHLDRISTVQSSLEFQEGIISSLSDYVVRAEELATEGANETNSVESRKALAQEVYAIRDSVVALANSTYQGVYIYGAADDDDPPYDQVANYTPATGTCADTRYAFDNETGTDIINNVAITDSLSVQATTSGDDVFSNLIYGLEQLARSLDGYSTEVDAGGVPTGDGEAYDFENDYSNAFSNQTEDIAKCIDLIKTANKENILTEQASLAGRLTRLEISKSILQVNDDSSTSALATLQEVDIYEAATNLTNAQTALNASFLVTSKLLSSSLLDYI